MHFFFQLDLVSSGALLCLLVTGGDGAAEGLADRRVQKAPTENGLKAVYHLPMKFYLTRRRIVAISSMKTSYWSTDSDAGLTGGPGIFINKSLVAGCSASMQSHHKKRGSECPDHLKCESGMKSARTCEMLNMFLVLISTIFYKISRENTISPVTIKSLLLACMNECKCAFAQLVFRKFPDENESFLILHSSKTILRLLRLLREIT